MQPVAATAYLLLGTNLGNREQYLTEALDALGDLAGELSLVSSRYETEPWGTEGQAAYLNQAVALRTSLAPVPLLRSILEIERSLGRTRNLRWEDRTIDIDILYYDALVFDSPPTLEIPHPRLHLRNFVLYPLCEIAPRFVHPVLNRTNLQLLEECTDTLSVWKR